MKFYKKKVTSDEVSMNSCLAAKRKRKNDGVRNAGVKFGSNSEVCNYWAEVYE